MSIFLSRPSLPALLICGALLYGALLCCAVEPAMACNCTGVLSPCGEVAAGSAVFTGRVISVSPAFLNRLNRSSRSDASRVGRFYNQLLSGVPAENLQVLKETFRALVPALSPDSVLRLNEAKSRQELLKVFDSVLDHGSYVTLEVKTVFTIGGDDDDKNGKAKDDDDRGKDANSAKVKDDDDHAKNAKSAKNVKAKDDDHAKDVKNARNTKVKDDDDDDDDDGGLAAGKLFSVWTPSFDCGVEFQIGETYLVYASMDEDTDTVETDTCMGTRRLSDAGADLPYLSFLKDDPKESGRLDGFVTSDSAIHANPPQSDTIPSPVAGVLIELKSDDATRYTTSGKDGRFVFDGLADDGYKLTGYTAEYPDPQHVVAGPDELKVKPKACTRHVLLARPG
jgi:hypothetical protein